MVFDGITQCMRINLVFVDPTACLMFSNTKTTF
jgi:hypothetical protein